MKMTLLRTAASLALGVVLVSATMASAQERLGTPDVVFVNGKIYTGAPGKFVAAVAVKDGKVLATGTVAQMRALAGTATKFTDLGGKTTLPGFYDNHVHVPYSEMSREKSVDLSKVKNLADLQQALKAFAATLPAGAWITGEVPHATGDVEAFPEGNIPTRWDIDAATPNNPVILRRGAHITITNTKALEVSKVVKGTPQPSGGAYDVDKDGVPNGIFREAPGRRLVSSKMPAPPKPTDAEGMAIMRNRLKSQLALGVTSLNVPGMRPGDDFRLMQMLYSKEQDDLPRATIQLRVYPGYDAYDDIDLAVKNTIKEIEGLSFYTGFGNDHIKLGAIKMSIDGAFGGQSALLIDSYVGRPGYHGQTRIPMEALYPVAKRATELGWQLGIHVIGDKAVEETVDVLDRILKENPNPNARHYLHHIAVKPPQRTIDLMAKDHILASMQPNFTYTIAPYYKLALSPEKLQTNNPEKSLLDAGIKMSLGSDGLPDGPLIGIYGAATRKGIDGVVYGPAEKLTLEQALYNVTVGSAYQTFDEKTRGTLEPGMVADMVVLPEDIFTGDIEHLKTMQVEETIVGGKVVYKRDPAKPVKVAALSPAHALAHALGLGCDEDEDEIADALEDYLAELEVRTHAAD